MITTRQEFEIKKANFKLVQAKKDFANPFPFCGKGFFFVFYSKCSFTKGLKSALLNF